MVLRSIDSDGRAFSSKGLHRFHATGSTAGIQPSHARKLRMQLAALETAITIEEMNMPGFRLHPLVGAERGRWSIWVNGNWRLTFGFATAMFTFLTTRTTTDDQLWTDAQSAPSR
jgi:proteic killer suppression protein